MHNSKLVEEGYIDFPILGKLYVVGLRQSEVINLIESKLRGQLVNPIVTMRFLNARVTVLGEVAKPGTYTLNNGRMTLLEALKETLEKMVLEFKLSSSVLIYIRNQIISIKIFQFDMQNYQFE